MKWALRTVAERSRIWKMSEMRELLAEHGLKVSHGKMSLLWTGELISVRLDDLEVICSALDCRVEDLLIRESTPIPSAPPAAVIPSTGAVVRPVRRFGRTTPP